MWNSIKSIASLWEGLPDEDKQVIVKLIAGSRPKTTINYVKLSGSAHEPTSGSEYAAGYDLYADLEGKNAITLLPGEVKKISSGIAIELPEGTFGAIYARSGMATKRGLAPANKTGVIDSDYRGPVIVALKNESNETQIIEHGERIAQLVIQPYIPALFNEVNSIGTTARGDGGFGSTGSK